MSEFRCLTWHQADAFDEVAQNMALCQRLYSLRVDCLQGSFRDGLQCAVDQHAVRAIFMGQRSVDPFAAPDVFAPTSAGWPDVMRVNPLLDWTYNDIWLFTRIERVPICALYRVGFTSLGPKDLTVPNPALRIESNDGSSDGSSAPATYAPAWKLRDCTQERAGRLTTIRERRESPQSHDADADRANVADN